MTREEAINKVRQMNLPKETKEILEALAPELAESEDERIRVRLIEYFKGFLEGYEDCYKDGGCVKWEGLDVKRILAYLEKQKEQKPAQSEEEKEYVRTLKGLVSDFIRDSGGGITDVEYYQNICDWLDGRHIEQKPVEYLSKDKVYAIMSKLTKLSTSNLIPFNSPEYKKINEITSDIRSLLDYPIEQKPRWEINNPHTTKWTKEMIDEKFEELVKEYHKQKPVVTHGETYHVDTLGTQQVIAGKMPQKPAEWSEEDEEISKRIIADLRWGRRNTVSDKDIRQYDEEINWMENRLKSLRPVSKEFLQPHWKPSEEHFQGLRRAILKADTGSDAERTLKDIYEQLKKL